MNPSEASRSADLLERLLTDAEFRAHFRKDPAAMARQFGVPELAEELASVGKSMQTLELRESRSGLAGVVMAAAVEVVGVAELVQHLQVKESSFTPEAARVVSHMVTRQSLKAVNALEFNMPGRGGTPLEPSGNAGSMPQSPFSLELEPAPGESLQVESGDKIFAGHSTVPLDQDAPSGGGIASLYEGADAYPGDGASRETIAAWMARRAQQAGLPAELPVMAAIVESGLRNLDFGDADSVGFFQMRLSIWNQGEYSGYPQDPELQLQWFIEHAQKVRQSRIAQGSSDPAEDPGAWGEWIADVERPAARFRGRYQLRLDEARELVEGSHADASFADVESSDFDSGSDLLASLLDNPRLHLPPRARADLEAGLVDQRLVALLSRLTQDHDVGLSVIKTGHSQFTSSGSISNHFHGRGLDISMVDGAPVSPGNPAARALVEKLLSVPSSIVPSEVISPFRMGNFSSDAAHMDHIHLAFDDPIPADFQSPAPEGFAGHGHSHEVASVAPAIEQGRASAVFAAVDAGETLHQAKTLGLPAIGHDHSERSVVEASVADADLLAAGDHPQPPISPEDLANTNAGGLLHGSEFGVPSPEGALGPGGRVHAGYDLFATGGSPVRAPFSGTVIDIKASRGSSGQLFGGTVKVQCDDGRVWVFRHVDPGALTRGMRVQAGQEIAQVTPWSDGPPHAHIELWKSLDGGYVITNLEDPLVELKRAYGRD